MFKKLLYMEEFKQKKPIFSDACERLYKRITELVKLPPMKISELAALAENKKSKGKKL